MYHGMSACREGLADIPEQRRAPRESMYEGRGEASCYVQSTGRRWGDGSLVGGGAGDVTDGRENDHHGC